MVTMDLPHRIESVRRFNRFYTRQIGLLEEGVLQSPFTLGEARVLYEIAHHDVTTASQLAQELGLDAGYLSRILRVLQERGVIERTVSASDRRQNMLSLTRQGAEAFSALNAASRSEIDALLSALPEVEQNRLIQAMESIERMLGGQSAGRSAQSAQSGQSDQSGPSARSGQSPQSGQSGQQAPYNLRPPRCGDMGWVIHRHGVLYNQEYGWDERFEGLVAEVVADFIRNYDPRLERCWIAELDGENVGSVFVVKHREREAVARLRMLLVEPKARGLGIGRRLAQECTRFAREAGYHTITLWTNSVLEAARGIYAREGYRLVHAEPHDSFGDHQIGETWEMTL